MSALDPLRLLLAVFAAWSSREKQKAIDYLLEENRILRQQLRRRPRLTDEQRRRLAVKGRALGRRLLATLATLATPDTILAWHRKLIARGAARQRRAPGRPPVQPEIRRRIVHMATDNPTWGYARIQGALRNLRHQVARSTIARTLRAHGIAPAPQRPTPWCTFVRAHARVLLAADFFTANVWTARGLVSYHVLFAIQIATRAVRILGVTTNPGEGFVLHAARELIGHGFLRGQRFLIVDRDRRLTAKFRELLAQAGVQVVVTAFRAPDMNAFAERFVRTVKSECLERLILFGEGALRRALREFLAHYHAERNHQGVGNELLQPGVEVERDVGPVQTRERLGGMLRYYYRAAG